MTQENMTHDWDAIMNSLKSGRGGPKKSYGDEWKANCFNPKLKSDGTWDGIIRFLPRPVGDGDGNPSLKVHSHAFNDIGGWYIELCPTTYGDDCPQCQENSRIYKSGSKPGDKKRKTYFYSNILVVKDPQNPENEGKVFIYRYGKTMYEQIMDKCDPKDPEMDTPINVFHPKLGTNYRLKIKLIKTKADNGKEIEYPDSKASTFNESVIPLSDEVIKNTMPLLHKLGDICSPEKIKSYEALEERLDKVMGKVRGVAGAHVERSVPSNSVVTADDLPSYQAPTVSRAAMDDDDQDDFIRSLQAEMGN